MSDLDEEPLEQQVESIRNQIKDKWRVPIVTFNHQDLHAYGMAFANNTRVTDLIIADQKLHDLVFEENTNNAVSSLLLLRNFVKTSPTLRRMECGWMHSVPLVRMLLQAAAANPNIQEVGLCALPNLAAMIQVLL